MQQANSQNLSFDVMDSERFKSSNLFHSRDFELFRPLDDEEIYENVKNYNHLGETNPYLHMIDRAAFIRRHGLTPIFMVDETGFKMLVTSEEHYKHRLN